MAEETRVIYIKTGSDGWQKVTIPATARVTFGPLTPGGNPMGNRGDGLYLRVYKTKEAQLAVFPNVTEFRDASVIKEVPSGDGFTPVTEIDLIGNAVVKQLRGKNEDHICTECNGGFVMTRAFDLYICDNCGNEEEA